jgi:hypothetical protein
LAGGIQAILKRIGKGPLRQQGDVRMYPPLSGGEVFGSPSLSVTSFSASITNSTRDHKECINHWSNLTQPQTKCTAKMGLDQITALYYYSNRERRK